MLSLLIDSANSLLIISNLLLISAILPATSIGFLFVGYYLRLWALGLQVFLAKLIFSFVSLASLVKFSCIKIKGILANVPSAQYLTSEHNLFTFQLSKTNHAIHSF